MRRQALRLPVRVSDREVMMINEFHGDYRFLSNFWPSPIVVDRIDYPTVEHAYQAFKAPDRFERQRIASLPSPGKAKREGAKFPRRPDWSLVKIGIMENLLRLKFADPELAGQLIATGDEEIVEGNTWKDCFWGVCNGEGRNELGKLLMKIRSEIAPKPGTGE